MWRRKARTCPYEKNLYAAAHNTGQFLDSLDPPTRQAGIDEFPLRRARTVLTLESVNSSGIADRMQECAHADAHTHTHGVLLPSITTGGTSSGAGFMLHCGIRRQPDCAPSRYYRRQRCASTQRTGVALRTSASSPKSVARTSEPAGYGFSGRGGSGLGGRRNAPAWYRP